MSTKNLSVPFDDLDFYLNNPLPTFARLRREDPVHYHAPGDYYLLTKHEDVVAALKTPEVFSSLGGLLRDGDATSIVNEMTKGTLPATDAPEHTKLRRKVSRGLTPRRVAEMEPFIRKIVRDVVDAIELDTPYDFVHDIAENVPSSVLGRLSGIPDADHRPIVGLVDKMIMQMATNGETMMASVLELMQYLQAFVEERIAEPSDDLISQICAPDEDGETLDALTAIKFLFTIIAAGSETTRGLLGRGFFELSQNPDQHHLLREDPSLIESAVEEMLRVGNPAGQTARRTLAPIVVRGVEIPAKKQVILLLTSANFDTDVFGLDAEKFRVSRNPNPHVGFGQGPHFCLGANLARMETRIFFEELLARFSAWEIPDPPTPLPAFEFYRSFAKLPVVFTRRTEADDPYYVLARSHDTGND